MLHLSHIISGKFTSGVVLRCQTTGVMAYPKSQQVSHLHPRPSQPQLGRLLLEGEYVSGALPGRMRYALPMQRGDRTCGASADIHQYTLDSIRATTSSTEDVIHLLEVVLF